MYSRGSTGLSTYSQPERKPSKNQRVKVWARVRPTAYFDTEHLELLPDGRVGDKCQNYKNHVLQLPTTENIDTLSGRMSE
jgi:hypothetical protein